MDTALVARINNVFNQILQLSAVHRAITEVQAAEIVGGSSQRFDAFVRSELKRWPEVVKAQDGIMPVKCEFR
jgi:tripartite-type tricarboxylate transporter receptor subunit TctC